MHGVEENSSEIFVDWAQDRSLSFAKCAIRNLDDSWLEIGDSNLKIAAKKGGLKDKTGRKYALISYCVPVRDLLFIFFKLSSGSLIAKNMGSRTDLPPRVSYCLTFQTKYDYRWTLENCLSRK